MSLPFCHLACISGLALILAGCTKEPQSEGEKIAKGSDCFSCHAIDRKVIGPAFNDVAKNFTGTAGAQETLIDAIVKGHSGTWGNAQMPPHPGFTPDQVQKIVGWILGLGTTSSAAAVALSGQIYTYKVDGKSVTSGFPIFQDGTKKVTMSVFHGYEQYNSYCFRCHGEDVSASLYAPDLLRSLSNGLTKEQFLRVAMEGRKDKGMPSWAGFYTPEEIGQIYEYVKARQLGVVDVGTPER